MFDGALMYKRYWSRIILLGVILSVISCNSATINTPVSSTRVDTQLTLSPSATRDAKKENTQELYQELNFFNVNLSCAIPCWGNFQPSKNTMAEIFGHFSAMSKNNVMHGAAGDANVPNNAISVGSFGISIVAFSDSTQPVPMLRAFMLHPATADALQSGTPVDQWLPTNVLNRFGDPSEIIVGNFNSEFYYIALDYKAKNMLINYQGNDSYLGATNQGICLSKDLPDIRIWVYGETEKDGWSLIQDVNSYKGVAGYNISPPKIPLVINTAPDQIAKITTPIRQGNCLSPDTLAAIMTQTSQPK